INLPVANDGEAEGLEEAVFSLQGGDDYEVNPEANGGTFRLVDTPDQVPVEPPEPPQDNEPNDIISLAVATGLSTDNSQVSIDGSINYDNSNRYDLETGRLYIDFTEDVDLYAVDLVAGDVLRLDIDAGSIYSSDESPDTILRLFDGEGNQLAQSDDDFAPDELFGPGRQDSYLEFTAETDGTYYVGVSSFGNGEFGFTNDPYDPKVPGSGTGRSSGLYKLNLRLNEEFTAEETEIPAGNGEGPTVSISATPATYDSDDNLISNALVQYTPERRNASILTLGLDVDGTIPPEGVELYLTSNIDLSTVFSSGAPFSSEGVEVLGAVFNDLGEPIGLKVNLNANSGFINLNLDDPEEAPTDGEETLSFTLEPAAGYVVGDGSFSTTIYDTLDDVPPLPTVPTVGISITEGELIESEGNTTILTFTLDAPPPPEGVTVNVDSGIRAALGDFDVFNANIVGGNFPSPNFRASGFFFTITEQTATIEVAAFDETTNPEIPPEDALEGIEEFTFTLQPGVGYAVAPLENSVTVSIADNPDSVVIDPDPDDPDPDPEPTIDLSEGNNTIPEAIVTGLSASNPSITVRGTIDTDRATRNVVDASEDVDMYRFELKPGDKLTVDVDSIPYEIEGVEEIQRLDSELRLFDAEGNELQLVTGAAAPDEVFTANRDAYLEFVAEDYGVFYVGVAQLGNRTYNPFDATDGSGSGRIFPDFGINIGEYELTATLEDGGQPEVPFIFDKPYFEEGENSDDTIDTATPTGLTSETPTVTIEGEIAGNFFTEDLSLRTDNTEDADMYSVELAAGDVLRLDIDARINRSSSESPDTILRLFDADGNQLAQSDDDFAPDELYAPGRQDSYLEFTATEAGTYYVGVSSFGNGEFGFTNDPYDPNVAGSGTGRSDGAYTLNLSLNVEPTPQETVIPAPTGEGATVSLSASAGTFDGDDNLLANALVQFEDGNASILTLGLNVDGDIPAEGLEVFLTSNIDLSTVFSTRAPFSPGEAEVLGAVYDDTGAPIGLRIKLTSSSDIIN
ncbi:PPC domain-containing protein, partial [Crocosphaera watsonii]